MKSKADSRHKNDLAFLDMVFNLVLAFAFLFLVSWLMVRPPAPPTTPNIKLKAELIIQLSWPDGSLDDVDMWLQLPDGRKVMYLAKDKGIAVLDRDDLGGFGDLTKTPEGEVKWIKLNRELITIRAIEPGRYIVALHVFSAKQEYEGVKSETVLPFDATLEMTKLNPQAALVVREQVRLTKGNERITVFAFTIDDKGDVINIEKSPADAVIDLASPAQGAGS
jgi:hypothetical protein